MEHTEAFFNAFQNVMPQLGLEDTVLIGIDEFGKKVRTPEIACIIGIVGDLRGSVIFAMDIDTAKTIAGTMMGGMELEEFDEIAQSAISELGNMLAANACTELSLVGVKVDVSTPTLMIGNFSVSAAAEHVTRMNLSAAGLPFEIYLSLDGK
jgi:chemotaxis protein CheX